MNTLFLYEDVKEYFSNEEFQEKCVKKVDIKDTGKSAWADRNPRVLSDRRHQVAESEEKLEGFEKHCDGEEKDRKGRKDNL